MILGVSFESAGPAIFFEAIAFAHRAGAIPLRALADVVRFLVIVTTLLWRRFLVAAGSSGDLQELIAIPVQFQTGLRLLSLVAADVNLRGFDSR